MIKITCDAGHAGFKDRLKKIYATSGKRDPDGIPEWEYNDKVIKAFINYLSHYEGVAVMRLDDPTGKTDISLQARADKAEAWGSQAHYSAHHNAFEGRWHKGGGVETLVRPGTIHYEKSLRLAKLVHPKMVKAMGLTDRGIKPRTDLMMISNALGCPSILSEGGFMDSSVDILAMRNDVKMKAQGEAAAQGYVEFFNLKKKETVKVEVIKLTDGQQKAADKLVHYGMLAKGFDFPNDTVGRTLLTVTTMFAPLLKELEDNGALRK